MSLFKVAAGATAAWQILKAFKPLERQDLGQRPYFARVVDGQLRRGSGKLPLGVTLDDSYLTDARGIYARGKYRSADRFSPAGLVLHWPGNSLGSVDSCARYLQTVDEGGIHFVSGWRAGGPVVAQLMPINLGAWHAAQGDGNRYAWGVEIGQEHNDLARAINSGERVEVGACPPHLTLDARNVRAVLAIIIALRIEHGLVPGWRTWRDACGGPPLDSGRQHGRRTAPEWLARGVTVFCHGDIQDNRADPWAWYPQLAQAWAAGPRWWKS
jgi:hypothetical protein